MINKDWLGLIKEEIVDPDREICDPHHHLWHRNGSKYLLEEFLLDIESGHNITSTIYVECESMYSKDVAKELAPVGETEFVQGVAAMSASGGFGDCRVAKGIVGFADLSLGSAVQTVLESHVDAASKRFKGIRHATGWHESSRIKNSHSNPKKGEMLTDSFLEGFAILGRLNLSFDAWCYHEQIPEIVELASIYPETKIVLDHFGGPLGVGPYEGKGDQVFGNWKEAISELASSNNVYFKLGGINMKVNGYDWHKKAYPATSDQLVDLTGRYYEFCINLFGSKRCMFESNFPVDKVSVSYHILWNAFKKLSRQLTEEEKKDLFYQTAATVYNID